MLTQDGKKNDHFLRFFIMAVAVPLAAAANFCTQQLPVRSGINKMSKKENILLAAIVVATHLPLSAMEVVKISREYGVDHREVMTEVKDMLNAESSAQTDMEGEL